MATTKTFAGIGPRYNVPEHILYCMEAFAFCWCRAGWTLRSGGAVGSDTAFETGCRNAGSTPVIRRSEDASLKGMARAMRVLGTKYDRAKPYVKGLFARDFQIVLGDELDCYVDFVITWTPGAAIIGGTGHGIGAANAAGIKVYNMGDIKTYNNIQRQIDAIIINTYESQKNTEII